MVKIYKPLYPLAWLYGLGVRLRNALFDCGVLRSVSFPLPVICVGNLTVGGTGKTPPHGIPHPPAHCLLGCTPGC